MGGAERGVVRGRVVAKGGGVVAKGVVARRLARLLKNIKINHP